MVRNRHTLDEIIDQRVSCETSPPPARAQAEVETKPGRQPSDSNSRWAGRRRLAIRNTTVKVTHVIV
jgi:hypothetical protein